MKALVIPNSASGTKRATEIGSGPPASHLDHPVPPFHPEVGANTTCGSYLS